MCFLTWLLLERVQYFNFKWFVPRYCVFFTCVCLYSDFCPLILCSLPWVALVAMTINGISFLLIKTAALSIFAKKVARSRQRSSSKTTADLLLEDTSKPGFYRGLHQSHRASSLILLLFVCTVLMLCRELACRVKPGLWLNSGSRSCGNTQSGFDHPSTSQFTRTPAGDWLQVSRNNSSL